jgi:hypothetical protein
MHVVDIFLKHSSKLVAVYAAAIAEEPCLNLAFLQNDAKLVHLVLLIIFYVPWIVSTKVTQLLAQIQYFSTTQQQKSSEPGHNGSQNTFQAIAQQPTGYWPNAMYSRKGHGEPDTTIPFSGTSLHLSTR